MIKMQILTKTRMHSSRIRTARFSGRHLGEGVSAQGGVHLLPIACWDTPHPRRQNDRRL